MAVVSRRLNEGISVLSERQSGESGLLCLAMSTDPCLPPRPFEAVKARSPERGSRGVSLSSQDSEMPARAGLPPTTVTIVGAARLASFAARSLFHSEEATEPTHHATGIRPRCSPCPLAKTPDRVQRRSGHAFLASCCWRRLPACLMRTSIFASNAASVEAPCRSAASLPALSFATAGSTR
jgi:hypothetical protein